MSQNNFGQNTQSLLSLGYLYLIVMGILNEALFFQQVDVHILKYSSILDVLISPIDKLMTGAGLGLTLFILVLIFVLPSYLAKKNDKPWFKKAFKLDSGLSQGEVRTSIFKILLFYAAILIFGVFIGSGVGKGLDLNAELDNNEVLYNDTVTFMSGDSERVAIVGKNTSFLFYLTSENSTVNVSPISGVIKSIQEVEED